jgi:signal transduction histidine kinase
VRGLVQRSVALQLRLIGAALLALVALVAGASLWSVTSQSRDIQLLTLAYGPAFDANNAVLLDMTEANAGWSQLVSGSAPLTRYRLKRDVVAADLQALEHALSSSALREEQRSRYLAGVREQRADIDAWFSAATRAEDAQATGSLAERSALEADAINRFRLFRDSNRDLAEVIRSERDAARQGSRASVQGVLWAFALTGVLGTVIVVGAGELLKRSLGAPLARLRRVMDRQRDGDREALADVETGGTEVRALAADFNGLTRANGILEERQAEVLLAHRLAIDVARAVHGAKDVRDALGMVCAMLGEGLAADRVLLYSHDEGGQIDQRRQWHRYDLPDLPPLPPSLAREVHVVNSELRRTASFFAPADLLSPEVQQDPRAARFHAATGARSLLMVPVGVGEQGLGVLAVMMVDAPRRWRRHEVQAVQQCAGYLAQAVVAMRLSQMQDVQVQQLTELDRQKTDFMATVSHELRTPLTSIAGYLEMLEDGDYGELSVRQSEALGTIGRNAARLRGMIEDLLVLNRIEASGVQSTLAEVQVSRLLSGVVEVLLPTASMAEVDLQMAPVESSLVVAVDLAQMERTFINLGSNAVKFTPAGGRVELTAERDGERVLITVADSGIGIPEADQDRLFQRFFRARNAHDAAIPGTGLGLVIARTIVTGHGGELRLESVEGRGTTVRVWLPLAGADSGNGAGTYAV